MDKVLLVGPDLAKDADLHRLVEREEFEIIHAANGIDALAMLCVGKPSIAIVDHQLQAGCGVEVLRTLRRQDSTCEVILATGDGNMEAAIEALRAGALDYLHKPFEPEQLRVALGRGRERVREGSVLDSSAILVVDDDERTCRNMGNILRRKGYRVLTATDGGQAVELAAKRHVDVILCDIKMPVKDGIAVLSEVRSGGTDVEVIMISGYGDEEAVIRALREGAINFLKKPVEIEQMLIAVEKAIDQQRLRRSLAFRTREMELMEALVIRLTDRLELVVETQDPLSPRVVYFVRQLLDELPLGVVVMGADHRVIFANRHVAEKSAGAVDELSPDWLEPVGIRVDADRLRAAVSRVIEAKPGTIEALPITEWAFLLLTPLRLIQGGKTDNYVALGIRGERDQEP